MSSPTVAAGRMDALPYLLRIPSTVCSRRSRLCRWGVVSVRNRSSCSVTSPSGTRFCPVMVRARIGTLGFQASRMRAIAARLISRET